MRMLTILQSIVLFLSVASVKAVVPPHFDESEDRATPYLSTYAAPQHIFSNPHPLPNPQQGDDTRDTASWHFPTVRESAAMARKIMHLTTIGELVTTFPTTTRDPTSASANEHLGENKDEQSSAAAHAAATASLSGNPIGLMEYYADCDPTSGNPILLAIDIATPFRNYAAGSNISLSIRWWPDRSTTYALDDPEDEIPTPHTPAALPRFSLHGHLEMLPPAQLATGKIQSCFLRAHPDSKYWQPGNDVHTSAYVQLVVEHVYWFGGFGDRARIQWLPIEVWHELGLEEIMKAELPGEARREESDERKGRGKMPGHRVAGRKGKAGCEKHQKPGKNGITGWRVWFAGW